MVGHCLTISLIVQTNCPSTPQRAKYSTTHVSQDSRRSLDPLLPTTTPHHNVPPATMRWISKKNPRHPAWTSDACAEEYTIRTEDGFATTCTVIRPPPRQRSAFIAFFMRRRRKLHSEARYGTLPNLGWLPIMQSSAKEMLSIRPVEVHVSVSVAAESKLRDPRDWRDWED